MSRYSPYLTYNSRGIKIFYVKPALPSDNVVSGDKNQVPLNIVLSILSDFNISSSTKLNAITYSLAVIRRDYLETYTILMTV